MKSFSISSQEVEEFLQSYHKFRQRLELFRPKELFAVMKDNQAQEESEELLQSFVI